jgi:hypothetical protein
MTNDASLKYLDYLQAAITRIAGYSFLIKGWIITITTLIITVSLQQKTSHFYPIGILAVAMFWVLDSYYLNTERGFRRLFNNAVAACQRDDPATFDMNPGPVSFAALIRLMFRPVLLLVHGTLILLLIALRFVA